MIAPGSASFPSSSALPHALHNMVWFPGYCRTEYGIPRHTILNILYKIRELECQFQIAAISDSLDRTCEGWLFLQLPSSPLLLSPDLRLHGMYPGRKYGRNLPSVYFTPLISLKSGAVLRHFQRFLPLHPVQWTQTRP